MLRDQASIGFKNVPGVALRSNNLKMKTSSAYMPVANTSDSVEAASKFPQPTRPSAQQIPQGGAPVCPCDMNVPPMFEQDASLKLSQKIVNQMIGQAFSTAKGQQGQRHAQPTMRWKETNLKSSKFAPPTSMGQQAIFGRTLRPNPVSLGNNRSAGLMNLKMLQNSSNDTSINADFSIKTAAPQEGSKQVFMQDNFIDEKFAGDKHVYQPLWATGMDRQFQYPKDLIHSKFQPKEGASDATDGLPFMSSKKVLDLQSQFENGQITTEKMYQTIREELHSYFDLPEGTGIFFAPSEATAQYIVLMIVQALNPNIDSFHNIFTGIKRDEINKNIQIASRGQFISEHVPFSKWKAGKPLKEEQVPGLPSWTTQQVLKTREDDSDAQDYQRKLQSVYELCELDDVDTLPILHTVGPLDQHMGQHWWQSSEGNSREAARVYDHIDGRLEKERAQQHLKNGDIIILNGSQYYQGPLQCAALFVPPQMMRSLQLVNANTLKKQWSTDDDKQSTPQINCFFSKNDFPEELNAWRQCIEEGNENPGLALRWSAASASMNQLSHLLDSQLLTIEEQWNKQMTEILEQLPILTKQEYQPAIEEQQSLSSITMTVGSPDTSNKGHLTQIGLSQIATMMSEDLSEKINWKSQLKVYQNCGLESLSELGTDELKQIVQRKITLGQPVGLYAAKHEEFGLKISMTCADTLQHSLSMVEDINEYNVAESRQMLFKLAIIAYALPELMPSGAEYKVSTKGLKRKSFAKSQFNQSTGKAGQDAPQKLSKMGFEN